MRMAKAVSSLPRRASCNESRGPGKRPIPARLGRDTVGAARQAVSDIERAARSTGFPQTR